MERREPRGRGSRVAGGRSADAVDLDLHVDVRLRRVRSSGNGRDTRRPGAGRARRRSMPAPPPTTPPRSCRRSPLPVSRSAAGANASERSPTVKIAHVLCARLAITLSSSLRLPRSAPSESSTIEPVDSRASVEQRERSLQGVVDARPEGRRPERRENRRVSSAVVRAGAPEHADSSVERDHADLLAGRSMGDERSAGGQCGDQRRAVHAQARVDREDGAVADPGRAQSGDVHVLNADGRSR